MTNNLLTSFCSYDMSRKSKLDCRSWKNRTWSLETSYCSLVLQPKPKTIGPTITRTPNHPSRWKSIVWLQGLNYLLFQVWWSNCCLGKPIEYSWSIWNSWLSLSHDEHYYGKAVLPQQKRQRSFKEYPPLIKICHLIWHDFPTYSKWCFSISTGCPYQQVEAMTLTHCWLH
jgi:hypothetical protein